MKIDTQNCVPVIKGSPETMVHPNKYIPADLQKAVQKTYITAEEETKKEEELPDTVDSGRDLKYLPSLIHTPVLTSMRTEKESTRRLVSQDDVEELNQKLEELFLGKKEVEETKTDSEEEDTSVLGRVFKTVFSYKTCKRSEVKRSARIAAAY